MSGLRGKSECTVKKSVSNQPCTDVLHQMNKNSLMMANRAANQTETASDGRKNIVEINQ
jgi:hypothetical protein